MKRPRTTVTLHAPARDLGKILAALEHDTAVDVICWRQNVPRVSPEVEITLWSRVFPPEWQGAEVSLVAASCRSNSGAETITFQWTVYTAGDDCAAGRITRTRSMGRSIGAA